MLQSQKQALRLRRAVLSNVGVFCVLLLSTLAAQFHFFTIETRYLALLALLMWLGHSVAVALIYFSLNLRFKDPSLTMPQMLWSTIWLSVFMALANDVRPLMAMGYLLVMSFGVYRLSVKRSYGFSLFILTNYFVSLSWVYLQRPNDIVLSHELFVFMGFALALLGVVLIGCELNQLRKALSLSQRELNASASRVDSLAITDALTGLYNRRYLMQVLDQQRALANRSGYGFVVCYVDLDRFKKVNDQYGHPFGDNVLKSFSRLMTNSLREVDIGARLSGEEFVLILADTDLDAARGVCERMAEKWRSLRFGEAPDLRLTLSAGITAFKSPESIDSLLERADKLLFEAKRKGRDGIEVEQPTLQVPFDFQAQPPQPSV